MLEAERATDVGDLLDEIARLSAAHREEPRRETASEILALRHRAGVALLGEERDAPHHPEPDFAALGSAGALPEVAPQDLTAALVRGGILRDGCLLVRGLMARDDALALADEIDRSFTQCDLALAGEPSDRFLYDPFEPEPGFEISTRSWVREGGGVLAVDSPRVALSMLEAFEAAGLPELVTGYLGEPALLSAQKTTLRRAEPQVVGAWHQDGAFMGEVRSLNLWLSLSRCGDEAPGLDIVPRRLDELVPMGTEGTFLKHQVSQAVAEEAAGDREILRPIFEPGDALLFDELFLHQTGSDPSMPKPRFAIESWFFGASGFPAHYVPIAV